MQEEDFWLFIIMGYTTIAHLYLESYEEYTMNTRFALVSVAFATIFYVFVWICWWIVPQ